MSFSGKTGTVSNANGATGVLSWAADIIEALLDTTSFDSAGHAENTGGIDRTSGSFEGNGQMPTVGLASGFALGNTAGTVAITGDARVHAVHPSNPADGLYSWTADYEFSGAVSVTV